MPAHPLRPIDVHQHLWPAALIEALRGRSEPPLLRGWTLHTSAEPPYEVRAGDHDPVARAALDPDTEVLVSLSTPIGIEALAPDEAAPLLDAWHTGVATLPDGFAGWAATTDVDPDLDALKGRLTGGFVGLQVSALSLRTPHALESIGAVLRLCESLGSPVLVHPGPVSPTPDLPDWWPAVVDYPAQLQAAWWSWHAAGREMFPDLRICFVAGAGLAPVHHERLTARGGGRYVVDAETYVDTSSYGRQGIDALTRVLGIDVIVLGSDRPYAEPADAHLGDAGRQAICVTNPRRLLGERSEELSEGEHE
jgi:predicted TIM-barrel fold metal-dependent hydrolase